MKDIVREGAGALQESRLRDNLLRTVREQIAQGGALPPLEGSAECFRDELVARVREMDEGE
ncbi:hypothetical protein ACH47B_12995 [Rhodococcus sp. NPDC019627]|uniref:hypothetical protein n=1 Tax=unclassified Rhodococcus (in: high G+C Gram-positive bacteria) TaxID=192944 RepID=UPI0033F09C81